MSSNSTNHSHHLLVSVIGLGYIGLPIATLLAAHGVRIQGYDVNPNIVAKLNKGEAHFAEPDLDSLLNLAVKSGQLTAHSQVESADIFIAAVPTPILSNHQPDLTYVQKAIETIAPKLKPGNLIVIESTIPVGTVDKAAQWLRTLRPDLLIPQGESQDPNQIYLAHCPERVLPGQIIHELINNDRVIGGINSASSARAKSVYEIFVKGKILLTDARTAEFSKLAENAFRDVNIAFANELANVCEALDVNVRELIKLANHHPRVDILSPGPGVGGHCIAVDPWFIIASAPNETPLLKAARQVNIERTQKIVAQIKQRVKCLASPKIACLGITYKQDTDDLRNSPALDIVEELSQLPDIELIVVDPYIKELPQKLKQNPLVQQMETEEALVKADMILLLVHHQAFLDIDKNRLANKIVIDTRGIW